MKGNIYLLHDEPISISEAMLLDRGYLELVGNSLEHANKSICQVAAYTLEEFAQDPDVREQRIPSRLDIIGQRVARQRGTKGTSTRDIPSLQSERGSNESELSQKHSELSESAPVRNVVPPGSESERCRKQGEFDSVRNPNSSSTGSNTNTYVSKSVVPRTDNRSDYPPRFQALPPDQRQKAIVAMAPLSDELCKDVLDQWAARPAEAMRNPFAYLLRMIEKARNGEFNLMTQHKASAIPVRHTTRPEAPPSKPHAPTDQSKAIASQKMAAMMSMVKQRGTGPPGHSGRRTA